MYFGIDVRFGAILGGAIGIAVFVSKDSGPIIDKLTRYLGILMLVLIGYVAIATIHHQLRSISKSVAPDNPRTLIFPYNHPFRWNCWWIHYISNIELIDAITGKEKLK